MKEKDQCPLLVLELWQANLGSNIGLRDMASSLQPGTCLVGGEAAVPSNPACWSGAKWRCSRRQHESLNGGRKSQQEEANLPSLLVGVKICHSEIRAQRPMPRIGSIGWQRRWQEVTGRKENCSHA